jgi:hypothetical protein
MLIIGIIFIVISVILLVLLFVYKIKADNIRYILSYALAVASILMIILGVSKRNT